MSRRALVFSDESALYAALTSELVPVAVQAAAARFWADEDGALWVVPTAKPSRAALEKLAAAGVEARAAKEPDGAREVAVWPQIIQPKPTRDEPDLASQTVLFLIEPPPGRNLVELAGELVRLGCDRVAYQMLAPKERDLPVALVRAFDPPYYTVAAAGEPEVAGYRALVPVRTGDTRTFIEIGWQHPMARSLTPPDGSIGLILGSGRWLDLPDGPWIDIFELADITMPAPAQALVPIRPPRRLEIELRLSSATRTEAPALWIIRGGAHGAHGAHGNEPPRDAIDEVDSLVSALPEDVVSRLMFAVVGPPADPVVILRARHGRAGPPSIDVPGVAMVPLLGLPNLFLPTDALLEPPLRRDTVRRLMAPEDDRVYWLAPLSGRSFQVESAPEDAFSPLADWIDYLIHQSADELAPWVRSVTFEFEPFQSIGTEWAAGPPAPGKDRDAAERPARAPRTDGEQPSPNVAAEQPEDDSDSDASREIEIIAAEPVSAPVPMRPMSQLEAELSELERAFLDSEIAPDAPARSDMWLAMARLLLAMERRRDASVCFARAVWERPRADVGPIVTEWARAERAAMSIADPLALLWLPVHTPRRLTGAADDANIVRAVAVHWIASALAGLAIEPLPRDDLGRAVRASRALQEVQNWLEAHDSALDVRTLWLLRLALAERAGGDPLALARARDRILQSLREGLSLERDVPTFLRFLDGGAGRGSVAAARAIDGITSLENLLDRTPRKRHAIEAPVTITRSYVFLSIAYGLMRLGERDRAHALRERAREHLDMSDPVHGYLYRAYTARIDQALRGLPAHAPLPPELVDELGALTRAGGTARYVVDRLREASNILEPHERVQAISGFLQRLRAHPDDDLVSSLHSAGPAELATRVQELIDRAIAKDTPADERARVFDRVMDLFPLLPSAHAVPALRAITSHLDGIAPVRRAELLQEALMLAGHFGRERLAGDIAQTMAELVLAVPATEAESLAPALGACLRDLGRVGLRDRVVQLSDALAAKLGGEGARELEARVRGLAQDDAGKPSAESTAQLTAAVAALEARLHVATGLAHLGREDQAAPILEATQAVLERTSFRVVDHTLVLTRALARALGECSHERALLGLRDLAKVLSHVTDFKPTNSHFCLSVIVFMESLVLGYARGDLAMGDFSRRFLDEDEYLVRRRIHRDIGETS